MNRRQFFTRTVGVIAAAAVMPTLAQAVTAQTQMAFAPDAFEKVGQAFEKGDIITIEGMYALNPQSGEPTGHLKQFVITSSVSGNAGEVMIPICPPIITDGIYRNTVICHARMRIYLTEPAGHVSGLLATNSRSHLHAVKIGK